MYRIIKRIFDFICALLGIVGTSPIWLFSIIMTELSDPGPLFYFAKRVGKDNKEFKMWKFRSMRVAKGANEASLRPDQDRIFWWGKWMRRLKIDELPQLINILNGTMSIVGPRPAAVDQVEITRGGEIRWRLLVVVRMQLQQPFHVASLVSPVCGIISMVTNFPMRRNITRRCSLSA